MTSNGLPLPGNATGQHTVASPGDGVHLAHRHAETLVRLVETAPAVSRRHQFFVWSQGPLQALLPHLALSCGHYARSRRTLGFTAFQNVVLSPAALAPLADPGSALLRGCAAAWVQGGGRAMAFDASRQDTETRTQIELLADELGGVQFHLHGVARPQRPTEIESLFVFLGRPEAAHSAELLLHAELVLPYLHATWRRVMAAEATLAPGGGEGWAAADGARAAEGGQALTEREREILRWAREGKSNLEIGVALDISALTVKNHIQKILRKLGASNRAQAVALAMSQGLV